MIRTTIAKALGLILCLGAADAAPSATPACESHDFESKTYLVCTAHAGEDLRLFLKDTSNQTLGSFARIDETLREDGRHLIFAMNAGMYHADRSPVGLYVERDRREGRLITAPGPGNFGLTPNGVFCVTPAKDFAVIESTRFAKAAPDCLYATQSGPMLVIDGALHPRFLPQSDSRYIRNGVGVSADGTTARFVISAGRVNFHDFARFFRDGLGLPNALYFDGNISRLYAPSLRRNDFGFPMGPIVGLVGRESPEAN